MPQPDDILQRAILDVNKIKQVSLKVAQEKLHQQYSNELKKKYIKEMQDNFSDNDDPTLLEGIFDDEQAKDDEQAQEEDIPGAIPGQDKPGEPTPASGLNGGEAGVSQPPSGQDDGLPPQAGVVDSQVLKSDIPTAGVDDTSDGSVIVLTINGEDGSAFDLSASEEDLKAQTSELLAGQQGGSPIDPNAVDVKADPANPLTTNMLPPGEEGRRTDNQSIFAGIFDEDEDPFLDQTEMRNEGVLKISDDILLEYIQKSLDNDEKFKTLSATIDKLQTTVDDLLTHLNKSNSELGNLKEQNIRLMFKNKALNDDSLSEPQKQSIVKALDKAKTLEEAKTVYSTVPVSSKPNNKVKDINTILSDNVTRKFIEESKKPITEEKVELTSITKKLFEKWGI